MSNREGGEFDLRRGIAGLTVDETNANANLPGGEGAIGCPASATATIEADEGEVVSIDTPTLPQVNLLAILEEAAPLPQVYLFLVSVLCRNPHETINSLQKTNYKIV